MSFPANSVVVFNEGRLALAKATVDLSNTAAGRFKLRLFDNTHTPVVGDAIGNQSGEVSSTNTGYTSGGIALTSVTCAIGSGAAANKAVFSSAAISFTVGSAGFNYGWAVIQDTVANKILFALDFRNGTANRVANAGDTFSLTPDSVSGWATV